MNEITLEATVENIVVVTRFVDEYLDSVRCPEKVRVQIDIVIDELFGNIAHYAYGEGKGDVTVRVEMQDNPRAVCVTFIDGGVAYNPLGKGDPDVTLSAEEREVGGLGIYMVKRSMDWVRYEYREGKNVLVVGKEMG